MYSTCTVHVHAYSLSFYSSWLLLTNFNNYVYKKLNISIPVVQVNLLVKTQNSYEKQCLKLVNMSMHVHTCLHVYVPCSYIYPHLCKHPTQPTTQPYPTQPTTQPTQAFSNKHNKSMFLASAHPLAGDWVCGLLHVFAASCVTNYFVQTVAMCIHTCTYTCIVLQLLMNKW